MTHPRTGVVPLTAFWLRSRATRRAAVILVAVFTLVTAVSLSVAALTLTTAQQQTRDFGRYQQSSYLSMNLGDLTPGTSARVRSAVRATAPRSSVWIGSTTLRPDSYTKFFFLAPVTSLQYLEGTDLRQAYPDRYRLESGLWPTSPRDVLVSHHLQEVLADKHAFTVLSGHATLRIVGVVTDRYATTGDVILGGAGTWESLTPLPASRQYQPVEGQLHLLWNPPATARQITTAVTSQLPKKLLEAGASDAVTGNLSHRIDPSRTDSDTDRDGVVSPVPLLLIVLLVAILAAVSTCGANRTAASTLTALGVPPRTVTRTQALAAAITAATAAVIGLTLGWVATAAVRVIILDSIATQPLAPPITPGRNLLLIAVAAILVVAATALLPTRAAQRTRARAASHRRAVIGRALRWVLAAVAIVAGATRTGPAASYVLLPGILLLGPDLLHLGRALLPRTRPRTLVTRGLMRAAAGRQAAAAVVIGACIAIPLLTAAQLASRQTSDATYTLSTIPARQIWVQKLSDKGDVRGVARALRTIRRFPAPVAVRDLAATPNADGSAGAQARFTRTATGGTALLVVPSTEALRRLLGDALPTAADRTLDQGGVLDFLTDRGPQRLAVYANGGELQTTTGPLPTRHVKVGRAWRLAFAGAILTRTAHTLHLPVGAPVKYLYPKMTRKQTQQAVAATITAGYDSEFINYTVPPPPPVLPVTATVFFTGLALAAVAVLLLTTTDQTRRLRSYSGRLIAIGITPTWTKSLLVLQTTLITTAGITIGLTAGLTALHHATRNYPVTVAPLLPAAATGTGTVLAALLVTLAAARNLTARDVGH